MSTPLELDDRRMRFEARRLALETFVKIHLEHVEGSRQLLLTHQRMMFTLSLGALAGLITLYAAVLRFGSTVDTIYSPARIGCAAAALIALVVAALMALASLQRVSADAAKILVDPFPDQGEALTNLFANAELDEHQIVRHTVEAMDLRLARQPLPKIKTGTTTMLLLAGIGFAGLSFLLH